MTQHEFIRRLRLGIATLPNQKQQEIIDDIQRHFEEGRQNYETESDLSAMLGDPWALALEYTELYGGKSSVAHSGAVAVHLNPSFRLQREQRHPVQTLAVIIGLFFVNLIVALPVAMMCIGLWLFLACGWLIAAAGAIALLASLIRMILPFGWFGIHQPFIVFFGSLTIIATGLLMAMGSTHGGKFLLRLGRRYLAWNKRLIAGRSDD